MLEEYLVGIALRNEWTKRLNKEGTKSLIKSLFWNKVITELNNKGKDGVKSLPAELKDRVENLFLVEEENDPEGEWAKTVSMLEQISIRDRIEEIKEKLEDKKYQKEMKELTIKLSDLTKLI